MFLFFIRRLPLDEADNRQRVSDRQFLSNSQRQLLSTSLVADSYMADYASSGV